MKRCDQPNNELQMWWYGQWAMLWRHPTSPLRTSVSTHHRFNCQKPNGGSPIFLLRNHDVRFRSPFSQLPQITLSTPISPTPSTSSLSSLQSLPLPPIPPIFLSPSSFPNPGSLSMGFGAPATTPSPTSSLTSTPITIPGSALSVALLDANHCPGAVQFLFKVLVWMVGLKVEAIERIGLENKGLMKSVLFLVATYVIGKERILLEISRRRNCKIHVDGRKMSVLRVLGYEDGGVFTEDESKSDVHVVGWNVLGETWPYFRPNFVKMKEIMIERGYSKVVGFVPTGWTYEVKRNKFAMRTKDSFEIHLVPYSEHSNYDELREYVKFLRPKRVIPTVGLDIEKLDSKHANAMRKHFAGLVDEMAIKHEFLKGFQRGCLEADENVENNTRTVLNKELDAEKHVTFSKRKTKESTESGFLAVSSSSMQEPGSRDSTLLNDKGSEEVIQELRDCLPIWVTQNQMLDLLSCSDGNVIEAVSNFYERETEFREQVIGHTNSVCTSQTSSLNDSVSLSKLGSVGSSPQKMEDIHGSQSYSLLNIRSSMKSSSLSSGKRKKNLDKKSIKKGKVGSKPESGGSKQSTITSEAITSYEEQVDQFIKIVNVDESSRYYVPPS
ncbi:DNA ligase 6 [Vitis vinifera]|uniref:DNA ligase 6 n=1 Tax=Vitis vinifera TaxID=29760 RepID=A0A438HTU7_VITVI|nr:DNA ligase 6 [Vitis vinifera]